jgi:hypothetical protein
MKITINNGQLNEQNYEVIETSIGSEKQINWANGIKINKISEIFMMMSQPNIPSEKYPEIISYCDEMNKKVDAKFWIERKDNSGKEIMKEIRG